MFNYLILVEVFFECIPEIIIQLLNTVFIFGPDVSSWPALTIFSLTLSFSLTWSVVHHFIYEHKLLQKEDPTYTSFDFRRMPKFDLWIKFNEFTTNRRTLNNHNRNPGPALPGNYQQQGRVQPMEVEVQI